ncbi:cupin [Streptomyces sp. AD55]|uniref:cupin n=1 Tax=Streptomyces sp. AD55 TaxID=3242895 RepID=UPI003527D29D
MKRRVAAIPGRPLPHGILGGCTEVIDVTDPHDLLGVEWMALGCCPVRDTDWCPPDESPGAEPPPGSHPPGVKEFCDPSHEDAEPVTIYAGVRCSTIGWSYQEATEHVRAALELGEQQAVESAFWRYTLAPRAIDLTPDDGPLSVAQGVAALEGCLAESYGGIGTLHVPAGAAALLGCCQVIRPDGDTLSTLAGNCVIVGAGYSAANSGPDGLPAPPGTAWLYISGPVTVRRGPMDVIPDRAGASIDRRVNDRRVLAERTYVPATTCTVCAVLVSTC